MKHLIRSIVVCLFAYTGCAAFYRIRAKRNGVLVRVITFHDVTDPIWFETQLQMLRRRYTVVSPTDFLAGAYVPGRINVLLTFDDGYASWVNIVAPMLRTYNMHGIFFLNSGLLDVADNEEKRNTFLRTALLLNDPHKTLTWEEAQKLRDEGHMLGGHTYHHVRLSACPEHEIRAEIVTDKKRIEDLLQSQCSVFAYPFGNAHDISRESVQAVRESGYTHAFTTIPGFITHESDTYVLPRICVYDGQSPFMLRKFIDGAYDLFRMFLLK